MQMNWIFVLFFFNSANFILFGIGGFIRYFFTWFEVVVLDRYQRTKMEKQLQLKLQKRKKIIEDFERKKREAKYRKLHDPYLEILCILQMTEEGNLDEDGKKFVDGLLKSFKKNIKANFGREQIRFLDSDLSAQYIIKTLGFDKNSGEMNGKLLTSFPHHRMDVPQEVEKIVALMSDMDFVVTSDNRILPVESTLYMV